VQFYLMKQKSIFSGYNISGTEIEYELPLALAEH
jgi:hypothetical protein